jgi:hypothetical protein
MRLVAMTIAAAVAGFATCGLWLTAYHDGRANMGGDLGAALSVSVIGVGLMGPLVYYPVTRALGTRLSRPRKLVVLPIVGAALAFIPFVLAVTLVGGPLGRNVMSPEAVFIYSIFAPAGVVFGVGVALLEN